VTVPNIIVAISTLGLVWVVMSFIDVNAHNMSDHKFAKWNAFSLLVELREKYDETSKVKTVSAETTTETLKPAESPIVKEVSTKRVIQKTSKKEKTEGKKVSNADIYKLAQLMYAENGSSSDDNVVILTGIVVMKRVKSKNYNNSISSVISEKGQYATYINGTIDCVPDERCLELAEEILRFDLEKDYPDSLVFQAEFKQGMEVYYKKGHEYFCTAKKLTTKQRKERNKRYGNDWDN
jgi:hypothetical protein